METQERYLMNVKTGSVDTEENWRADAQAGGWEFDAAGLLEVVRVGSDYYAPEVVDRTARLRNQVT